MSRIAIIPARGGSKRIPRKNIRAFRGKPIMAWSIDAALRSGVFDEVMVSTDDAEIAQVAREYGASVPYLRSATTAADLSTTAEVLEEVLHMYARSERTFELGCCLYPTAPFTTGDDLRWGLERIQAGDIDFLMPVTPFSSSVWRGLTRSAEGYVSMIFPENLNVRSQDLPTAYQDAGQWYWFKMATFMTERKLYGERTGSIVLANTQVQDIDTEEDWKIAEMKHQHLFPTG